MRHGAINSRWLAAGTVLARVIRRVGLFALGALCAWTAAALLYSSYCALLHCVFIWDYPRYFNMLWNTVHGQWFRYCVDANYLLIHFSFSLLLLAPIVGICDHPFVLSVLQWLMIVGGAAILGWTAHRHKLSAFLVLALVFFYLAYHFTQTTQLDEFHGMAAYILLVPWFYFCLCFRRGLVWLPFILILGLREDAAFVILPLLLYISARDGWRPGYIYAAVGAGYALLATLTLYYLFPALGFEPDNLAFVKPQSIWESFRGDGLNLRLLALFWTLLPCVPFLIRRGWPLLVIISTAIILAMGSAQWRQFYLLFHYPAALMACLGVGMLEVARRQKAAGDRFSSFMYAGLPVYLVAVTLFSYYWKGHLPGAKGQNHDYISIDPVGQHLLWVARTQVPPEGVLLTTAEWSGLVANRRDLITPETVVSAPYKVDILFGSFDDVRRFHFDELLKSREFGVRYYDGSNFVLQRGYDPSRNAAVLKALDCLVILFAQTRSHGGANVYLPGVGGMRYWRGDGDSAPVTLSYGSSHRLPPGRYRADFYFRAWPPRKNVRHSLGTLSVHILNRRESLAEQEIQPGETQFRAQALDFSIGEPEEIEPRVTGADAELWLDRVTFVPLEAPSG